MTDSQWLGLCGVILIGFSMAAKEVRGRHFLLTAGAAMLFVSLFI